MKLLLLPFALFKIWIVFPVLFIIFPPISAQQNKVFDATAIQTEWELIKNVSTEDPRFYALLTITNKGNYPLLNSGWKIYFSLRYHSNQLKAISPEFDIRHINGDLFSLSPNSQFRGIEPGGNYQISYSGLNYIGNYQDLPSGLFFVQDSNPQQAITLSNPIVISRKNLLNADTGSTYQENEKIKDIPIEKLPKIFPTPKEYKEEQGFFILNPNVSIRTNSFFLKEADFLKKELKQLFGEPLATRTAKSGTIIFQEEKLPPESYHLKITPNTIVISSSDPAGAFYGIRSLQSLFPLISNEKVVELKIPCVEVKDEPRFPIRAFMLDVARNFSSKKQIIKILEIMSLYKMNVLHLHFSDDEGWRLEIPGLPELTEVGAVRGYPFEEYKCLQPSYGSGSKAKPTKGTGKEYYSRKDFIEILKYATARHIKVIPEIESPGHAHAAIKAMNYRYRNYIKAGNKDEAERYMLTDLEDQSTYLSSQGYTDNVMNVALPSTYRFIEKVVDEIQHMYKEAGAPLKMIHMAGDEVPHGSWEKSPAVIQYLKKNPTIKTGDDLWKNYFKKMKSILKDRGLSLYGWEEIVIGKQNAEESRKVVYNEDFLKDGVLIDAWLNTGHEGIPYSMANMGYKVVLSCFSHLYLDLSNAPSFAEPGDSWLGYLNLKKTFSFSPFNYFRFTNTFISGVPLPENYFLGKEKLNEKSKSNIKGIQAALWGENLTHPDLVEYMAFPRLLAVAERAWTKESNWEIEKDDSVARQLLQEAWSVFVNKLGKKELPRLDYHLGGIGYRIPFPGAITNTNGILMNHQFPGFDIRYTTDGSEPTLKSTLYQELITHKGTIKAKAFDRRGRSSLTIEISSKHIN